MNRQAAIERSVPPQIEKTVVESKEGAAIRIERIEISDDALRGLTTRASQLETVQERVTAGRQEKR